jgi:O-antigen ligase
LVKKILGFAALITGLLVVVFWTEARGATLVAVPLIGLAIWHVRLPAKTILAGFAGLFVLAGAAYFSSNTIQRIVDNSVLRMGSGVETIVGLQDAGESSMFVRLGLYRAGLKAARQAPVFGYGHPNRVNAISAFTDDAKAPKFSHLHNAFLTHLVAGGVVGLLVFCLFVLTPLIIEKRLRPGSRNSRYMAWMFTITCVGGGLSNLVLNHDLMTNFFCLFVLAHMIVAVNEKSPPIT